MGRWERGISTLQSQGRVSGKRRHCPVIPKKWDRQDIAGIGIACDEVSSQAWFLPALLDGGGSVLWTQEGHGGLGMVMSSV